MAGTLHLQVMDRHNEVYSGELSGSIELGRQNDGREELYRERLIDRGRWRLVIAPLDEDTISRQHALVELQESGKVRLTNRSSKVPIRLSDGTELGPNGASCVLDLPAMLAIGRRTVQLQTRGGGAGPRLRALVSSVLPPGQATVPGHLSMVASRFPTITDSDGIDSLLRCVQTTMDVLHSAATSTDFFQKAAQAVVDMTICESARVLLWEQEKWTTAVVCTAPGTHADQNWKPSQLVLRDVLQQKRTFWFSPDRTENEMSESLMGVEVVVAAPILNRDGGVLGVIYGECRARTLAGRRIVRETFGELDARLVELLASGVATGLARMEHEKAALEAEVRFGQFFTKDLARELAVQKDLLTGQEREVSLLFADIRNFTNHSHVLGPAETVRLIGDVMGALSECVLATQGVLVDYIGDELMAMWGAPKQQPDHARLACRAALGMLSRLPDLNRAWEGKLGRRLDLGIGVNTGPAWVGNMGSIHKFKYGPLGETVNLASRVQGATKYLRCRLLITEDTRRKLDETFTTRRICKVRVVNVKEAVTLHELIPTDTTTGAELKARYEQALTEFEAQHWREAARRLGNLLALYPEDGPALLLAWRALQNEVDQVENHDPVWELPGK
jgi:adenylate cyclase